MFYVDLAYVVTFEKYFLQEKKTLHFEMDIKNVLVQFL